MEEGLLIPVSLTLEEAQAALKQLEIAARQAGRKIQDGLDPKPTAQTGQSISQLKTQLGQARAAAMFFTSSLGEMGEGGRRLQSVVGGVAGAFLGGGPLLLGLELARVAVGMLTDAWTAESRAAEAAAESARKAAEAKISDARSWLASLDQERSQLQGVSAGQQRLAALEADYRKEKDEGRRKELAGLVQQARAALNTIAAEEAVAEARKKITEDEARLDDERRKAADQASAALKTRIEMERQWLVGLQVDAAKAFQDIEKVLNAKPVSQDEWRKDTIASAELAPVEGLNNAEQGQMDAWTEKINAQDEALQRLRESYAAVRTEIRGMGTQAVASFAGQAAHALTTVTRQSAAYARAMKAAGGAVQETADLSAAAFASFLQNALSSVAEEAAGRAIFETAMGLAALARSYWDPTAGKEAGFHFAAAGEFAAVAAFTGVGAYAIGQTRGMTADEKASVAAAGQSGSGSSSGSSLSTDAKAKEAGQTVNVYFTGKAYLTKAEVTKAVADAVNEAKKQGWVN